MSNRSKQPRGRRPGDYDVAAQVGNGDDALEAEGVAIIQRPGVGNLLLPERVRRRATPEQRRVLLDASRLTLQHMAVLGQLDDKVAELRRLGMSWETVGWVTGLTAAGARKRWSAPAGGRS